MFPNSWSKRIFKCNLLEMKIKVIWDGPTGDHQDQNETRSKGKPKVGGRRGVGTRRRFQVLLCPRRSDSHFLAENLVSGFACSHGCHLT